MRHSHEMRDRHLFLSLCAAVWFINTCMLGTPASTVWLGLAVTFISIPAWTFIGSVFTGMGVFLFRVARVDVTGLSLWQKADIGLAMAVVLKPALGIPF